MRVKRDDQVIQSHFDLCKRPDGRGRPAMHIKRSYTSDLASLTRKDGRTDEH